jgi:hypothetical protein
MNSTTTLSLLEIWHKNYNLAQKHNLNEIPAEKAVFGIFGIVNDEPLNCRYVSETENLQDAVIRLFENPEGQGMKKFMQGPWIQMLQFELMPQSSKEERKRATDEWIQKFQPKINEEGEYPGYYEY